MCLIVTTRTGFGSLSPDLIAQVWKANCDGFGAMFAAEGRLFAWRGLLGLDEVMASIRAIPAGVPAAIHFRQATRGQVILGNAHPHWVVADEVALMHNGTLDMDLPEGSVDSDTTIFARDVLRPALSAQPGLLDSPEYAQALSESIGPHNRMVLLRRDGRFVTLNEHIGRHAGEFWFSKDPALAMQLSAARTPA